MIQYKHKGSGLVVTFSQASKYVALQSYRGESVRDGNIVYWYLPTWIVEGSDEWEVMPLTDPRMPGWEFGPGYWEAHDATWKPIIRRFIEEVLAEKKPNHPKPKAHDLVYNFSNEFFPLGAYSVVSICGGHAFCKQSATNITRLFVSGGLKLMRSGSDFNVFELV